MNGRLDSQFIQRVKDGVNLVEIVGQHVLLKKTGSNYVGLCPFHSERSPSFSVSEQKQLFHCYGCKKGGDVVKFVQELHGSSFSEALEELAERGNVALPKSFVTDESLSPAEQEALKQRREKTQLQYKLNRFAAKFYHDHLAADPRTKEYLRRRGVDEEMQKLFYLGSTPQGWSPLSKKLMDAKAPLELAKEMGLIRESTKPQPGGVPTFDLFRDRVMFPILDVKGKVVGFGGRTLLKDADGPKYLNSTESPLFQKSKTLYGLYQSQKSIRAEDVAIVVEGYFDYLSLYRAGFQNVVATCGTALTADHLKTLKRFCSKIVLLFDSDMAGQQATLKSMELGLSLGMVLYAGELPPGKDVDEVLFGTTKVGDPKVAADTAVATGELLPAGKVFVENLLKNSSTILDREIDRNIRTAGSSVENKSVALKQIAEWLRLFQDPVGREIRIEKVCRDLGVSRNVLEAAARSGGGTSNAFNNASMNAGGFRPVPANRGNPGPEKRAMVGPVSFGVGGEDVPHSLESTDAPPRLPGGLVRPLGPVRAPLPRVPRISGLDRSLLRGALKGGEYLAMLKEAEGHLPEGETLAELVQHSDIRLLFTRLLDGESAATEWESEIAEENVRLMYREALLEAGIKGSSAGEKADDGAVNLSDFQVVVRKALQKSWARFSQRFLPELTIQGDLSRSQEWLDVQNKIKELGNFYDQNE